MSSDNTFSDQHDDPVAGSGPVADASSGMSRRSLLKAGAVGAGVAGATWVTPSVLNMDQAFAAGSCPCVTPTTFNWSGYADGAAGLNSVVGNVRIVVTPTQVSGSGVAPNFVVQTGQFGSITRYWQMRQDATSNEGTAAQQTAVFTFTNATTGAALPLCGLRLTLLDIDYQSSNNNGWRDEAWISTTGGAPMSFTQTKPGGTGSPSGSGTPASRWLGTQGNIPDNSDDGNVTIAFAGSVSQFQLNYRNRPSGGTNFEGSVMRIGITNIQWCP